MLNPPNALGADWAVSSDLDAGGDIHALYIVPSQLPGNVSDDVRVKTISLVIIMITND